MSYRSLKSSTIALLAVLVITAFVWILRGIGVLTFIPGAVLWILILLCIVTAILWAVS